ncbi:MAG: presqualene diphosphate synthase HpnD [Pseudomonadota bacterium]
MTESVLEQNGLAATRHVHHVVQRSGTSFLWGMRVLPKARREAMYAIYAFCREVDDVADEPGAEADKLAALEAWRGEIDRLYAGQPTRPTTRALVPAVAAYDLPKTEFLAIIDGMEMDAREAMVAPDLATFELYCRRVAGAVGMLSIRAFGAGEPAAEKLAVALGEALQITNILRDLAEDAERGRLYLPRELIEAEAIAWDQPAAVLDHPGLVAVSRALAERARQDFATSRSLMAQCDPRPLKPCRLMMAVYEKTLDRLERRGWDRPREEVRISKAEKLWIVLRHGLQ